MSDAPDSGGIGDMAGPVLRGGEIAQAVIEAVHTDNPDKEIVISDHTTYVRVEAEGGCIIRRDTMEEVLGRPFRMPELEVSLTAFSGQIETNDDYTRFYLKKDRV
ncbi:MAG: MmoB/DmpM family protein [Bryobacterales bacterium]|nr:MmoB/DmpM family protein [Bryobacterales bacterium]